MLLLSKTYEVVTHGSADHGEAEETGFVFESEAFTFSELVRELRDYSHLSSSHANRHTWVTTEDDEDYATGDRTSFSLHFDRSNAPRLEKYWLKALKYSGLA